MTVKEHFLKYFDEDEHMWHLINELIEASFNYNPESIRSFWNDDYTYGLNITELYLKHSRVRVRRRRISYAVIFVRDRLRERERELASILIKLENRITKIV